MCLPLGYLLGIQAAHKAHPCHLPPPREIKQLTTHFQHGDKRWLGMSRGNRRTSTQGGLHVGGGPDAETRRVSGVGRGLERELHAWRPGEGMGMFPELAKAHRSRDTFAGTGCQVEP